MAAQAALIADTIVGMKRALRKEHDLFSGPDDPITQPTNRGNKLRTNAKHVREGALGYVHPEDLYKQKIEHAGYTRYILQSNPVRYDSEGDELDEDDEDSEADAAAAEENPFSEIALENFMCPLKHPSELPAHPSLSHAYTSNALLKMTQAIEAKLRQERALLWRARNLHRQFLGDSPWMPCGVIETPNDRWIFEPRSLNTGHKSSIGHLGRDTNSSITPAGGSTTQKKGTHGHNSVSGSPNGALAVTNVGTRFSQVAAKDVEMTDMQNRSLQANNDIRSPEQTREPKSEEVETPVGDLPAHPHMLEMRVDSSNAAISNMGCNQTSNSDGRFHQNQKEILDGECTGDGLDLNHMGQNDLGVDIHRDEEMRDGSSPEPPRRMTTRAQANALNPQQEGEQDNLSSSPSSDTLSSLPVPHPLFLVPDSIRPDANLGLSPIEAEDTRRLLWSYVQKQEETVRGFEHMLESLLRACRMKDDVFEWCKAEGHVGEMSDGEDWYDREEWGLADGEDLKKGADEDEIEMVEESRATNKRGRGRRA
ncbi:RXT2-like protein [Aspergillus avenaceus]|uniref:RXT2-like protein n=1 Tax=Aspergillus avenaceus TaxID=36643 RepID=A0A5N6TMD4_ASPAV|nr:RXT2-like protein [Aspergillus avenaceus]